MSRNPAKTDNLVDAKQKATFLECRDEWQKLNERANSAAAKRRQYQKEIKEFGFSVQQIKISLLLQTPEGEAEFRAEMASRLLAAAYSNASIGDQLALFLEPDRTPATDRAAKEGQSAAMRNEAHQPPYDSSVPQYKAWSDAFYAEQERQVKAGIAKLDAKAGKGAKSAPKVTKAAGKRGRPPGSGKKANGGATATAETVLITKAEKDAKAAALASKAAAGPPRRPAAQPVTRASLAANKAAVREEADSYFTRAEPKGNA